MIRRPPRSTLDRSSAASDVYKRQILFQLAKLYEDKLDYKNAIKYLYKSFDVTPPEKRRGRADCYNDIGAILFRQGKEEEALKLWKQALVLSLIHISEPTRPY